MHCNIIGAGDGGKTCRNYVFPLVHHVLNVVCCFVIQMKRFRTLFEIGHHYVGLEFQRRSTFSALHMLEQMWNSQERSKRAHYT